MSSRFISAKYHVSTLTVDYAGSDGTHLLRTGGTIAWRFNNPGNIRPVDNTKPIMGAIGIGKTSGNGAFLIFSSYEEGRAQKKALLRRKYNQRTFYTMLAGIPDKHGNMVEGYAPKSDKNDPVSYANSISKHTGLPVETVLSTLSDAQLDSVLDAMEKREGFHNQQDTRREKLIATTGIVISDGAVPKPHVPAKVKIGDKTYEQKTDAKGQLPRIAHTKMGEKVEVHLPTADGLWKKEVEFVMDGVSAAKVLFHDLSEFISPTAPKKAPAKPAPAAKRAPIRHIVQPGETLGKLATRYKTTVVEIRRHNPDITDSNKIFVGQKIGIYGKAPSLNKPVAPPAPAAKPANSPAPKPAAKSAAKPAAPARAKEGKGAPLAVVPTDQKQAPWMLKAIAEGKTWEGKDEAVISKDENFHKDIGLTGNLDNTAWCASFVNFCLKSSDTPYVASASSQFATSSKKFIKIDKPVYGAVMVMRNYVRETGAFTGQGHVTFVYGKVSDTVMAGLGGNQKDTIKLSPMSTTGDSARFNIKTKKGTVIKMAQRFHGFYIPATYAEYAKQAGELATVDVDTLNEDLFKIKNARGSKNESGR